MDDGSRATTSPTSAPTRCPNQNHAVEQGELLGGKVRGDVDGDGSPDVVYLVSDPEGSFDCRSFLVADTARGRIATPTNEQGLEYGLPIPRIHSLADIDGSGGEEILVDLEQGASTQFIGIFTVLDGGLERVRVAENSDFGNLFPYGGSVGHLEASNCAGHPDADVSVAVATANTTDYTIRTRLYEMKGAILVPLPRADQPPISVGTHLDQSEGFATSPFGDCPRGGEGAE